MYYTPCAWWSSVPVSRRRRRRYSVNGVVFFFFLFFGGRSCVSHGGSCAGSVRILWGSRGARCASRSGRSRSSLPLASERARRFASFLPLYKISCIIYYIHAMVNNKRDDAGGFPWPIFIQGRRRTRAKIDLQTTRN